MHCPFCNHSDSRVVDSRQAGDGTAVRRRRECSSCQRRFTTYERVEEAFPQILKGDGSVEEYDRYKAARGIRLAASKRPITATDIDLVLDRLEARMLEKGQRQLESAWIGKTITEELRDLDPVAYIRFASVYHGFSDIEEFIRELKDFDKR